MTSPDDPRRVFTTDDTPEDISRLLADDIAAIEQGRRQIAAGRSHDMEDVVREMEKIAGSPYEGTPEPNA